MASKPPSRAPLAGGAIIAFGVLAGVIIGVVLGQPSVGFVIGAGAGVLVALAIWLIDRRRG